MLYQMYETQRSLVEPFADFALAASKLYSNPSSPFSQTPLSQRISAGFELFHRLGKDYEKPQFGITTVDVGGVGVTIMERVEIDKPFCELRRFKRFTDDSATLDTMLAQPVVLVVAPLSGHYATLLRDTVRSMLADHKVYITDWKNARLVPMDQGVFHLDDYVNYVQEFIRHLQGKYGNCHVVSVCQPTVPVLAAVSLMASRGETTPLTLTMMGGPIDARRSPTAVNNLATTNSYEWFETNVIHEVPSNYPGAGRRVYPGFLQHTGFVAMNPDRHATSHYDYFKNLLKGDDTSTEAHRKFYDEYNAVLDMDAAYYLETIYTVFQDFSLVKGTWDVKSPDGQVERVRPQDITTSAILTVEGELDDISGAGQTRAAHDLCTGVPADKQRHLEVEGAGHYGIFSGRRWRETVYPQVRDFILAYHKQPAVPVDDGVGHDALPMRPAATRQAAVTAVETAPALAPAATLGTPAAEAALEVAQVTPPETPKTVLETALERAEEPALATTEGPQARAPEPAKAKPRATRGSRRN